jgi:hypothetical protein
VGIAAALSGAAFTSATAVAGGGALFSLMTLMQTKVTVSIVLLGVVAGFGWQQAENWKLRAANEGMAHDAAILSARVTADREAVAAETNALNAARDSAQREERTLRDVSPDALYLEPKYLNDWAFQQRKYAGSLRLFRRLQLSPPEVERLIDLLVERHIAINLASDLAQKLTRASKPGGGPAMEFDGNAEFNKRVREIGTADVERRIREFLGEERFAIYQRSVDDSKGQGMAVSFADAALVRGVSVTDAQVD